MSEAVIELVALGERLGVHVNGEKRIALEETLSYKRDYEIGMYARVQEVGKGPHFAGLDGSWSIKVYRTREDEAVKFALLGLSVSWHAQGSDFEAFFQMTDEEWDEFIDKVNEISEHRQELQSFLDSGE